MDGPDELTLDQAWRTWTECLIGNDPNSIFQQISTMIWDAAIFRLIVRGREVQIEKNPDEREINGALHSFIDRNFFVSQASAIRRLVETSWRLTGRKGVYSLAALLDDIGSHRTALTRKEYFRLRGKLYDYEHVRQHEREFLRTQTLDKAFFVPDKYDWESILEAHRTFDRLTGNTEATRQPSDVISENVLYRLKERLCETQEITNYVDKFVAHSATPQSRGVENIDDSQITFMRLWQAHRLIFGTANFLSGVLFSEDHMALPIENPGFLEYWDTPIFDTSSYEEIREALCSYREETQRWRDLELDAIWQCVEG